MTLDERKKKILESVIIEYVETAEPVGSRAVVKKHNLNISAATARNEMSDLEEMGNLLHGIYGYNAITWLIWDGDLIARAYRYLPPASGFIGGVRQIKTYQWSGEILKRGVV